MRKVLMVLLLLFPMIVGAQELVKFVLMPDGTYRTEEGADFVVVPFEGKTAHQIYQELASNVGATFNDPSKVMSGVEDAFIKIRAFSDVLIRGGLMGSHAYGGYYQLEFRIKDGRVRVSAPFIEEKVWDEYEEARHSSLAKKYFKDGKLRENRSSDYSIRVAKMNKIINRILFTTVYQDVTDAW